jgi:hypothetical protein
VQVHRLVFIVRVAGKKHRGHPVARRQRARDPAALGRMKFIQPLKLRPVGLVL